MNDSPHSLVSSVPLNVHFGLLSYLIPENKTKSLKSCKMTNKQTDNAISIVAFATEKDIILPFFFCLIISIQLKLLSYSNFYSIW